ncbi:uncharacterized protein [Argopecten irradians]|uniref:uncharacterized protein isoform X2 n=1 Tax=Argopecten irradians TaxID=31199 RepID=UPI00371A29D1
MFEGRDYIAVCGPQTGRIGSRHSQFEAFRRQISNRQSTSTSLPSPVVVDQQKRQSRRRAESPTTMISVGIGRWTSGKFSRISEANLSICGGIVVIGPFMKTENTALNIRDEAFKKFSTQNKLFQRRYKRSDEFFLLYPDGSKVKKLPDNSSNFTLKGYRDYLDPKRRYDRLRLYLCHKDNYLEYDIEVLSTESSDEDLPPLERPQRTSTPRFNVSPSSGNHSNNQHFSNWLSSSESDVTLPLVQECIFVIDGQLKKESFPNNVLAQALFDFVAQHCHWQFTLKTNGIAINPECRLQELTGDKQSLEILVEKRQEEDEIDVPAIYDTETGIQTLVDMALYELGANEEPTLVLKTFKTIFCRGRTLDIPNTNTPIEGDTSMVYVSRYALWEDAVSEMGMIDNLRFPLEVLFMGEQGADYGGPRKEFFRLILAEIKRKMIHVDDDNCFLRKTTELIATRGYYIAGIIVGLSAIQNGPCADFLDSLLTNWTNGEEYLMFKKGLERVGLWQLADGKL